MHGALEGKTSGAFFMLFCVLQIKSHKTEQMRRSVMIIDDAGARALMASVLKQALDDYSNDKGCPAWCSFAENCKHHGVDAKHCDAKAFIHSAWCASLCHIPDECPITIVLPPQCIAFSFLMGTVGAI